MTPEERFERSEHVTAGLVGERCKDREEYRQLWRETNAAIERLARESREADRRLEEKIDRLAEESRAQDRRLGERIDALVSAMGEYFRRKP
jgi:hypothetical protein